MSAIVAVHVAAGAISLLSGALALAARKGAPLHRAAGTAFFVSMLIMSATAAWLSATLPLRGGVIESVLTFYLVMTSWAAARGDGRVGVIEYGGFVMALGAAAGGILLGLQAAGNPDRLLDGFPPGVHYLIAGFAAWPALLDASVILRGGVSGRQRIMRHLWRMCFALTIAAINVFVGNGSKVLPEFLQDSALRFVPVIAPLILMAVWLVIAAFSKRFSSSATA